MEQAINENGVKLMSGKGLAAVRERIQKAMEEARSLGPTTVPMKESAAGFLREVEEQIGEGFEVLENVEELTAVPLSNSKAVQDCLDQLEHVPIYRKKVQVNLVRESHFNLSDIEQLYRAAETALGFRSR